MACSRPLCVVAICSSLLGACATEENKAAEAGAQRLSQQEIAEVFRGNTIAGTGPRGEFVNYYSEDGRKVNKEGGKITERKWWIDDSGAWCETLVQDDREWCGPKIFREGRGYAFYDDAGARIATVSVIEGNPEDL